MSVADYKRGLRVALKRMDAAIEDVRRYTPPPIRNVRMEPLIDLRALVHFELLEADDLVDVDLPYELCVEIVETYGPRLAMMLVIEAINGIDPRMSLLAKAAAALDLDMEAVASIFQNDSPTSERRRK